MAAAGALLALALAAPLAAVPVAAQPLSVRVTNASEPEFCAERDNITLTLTSKDVRSFRIEAVHPAYLNTLSDNPKPLPVAKQ